jgi:hypothetical protein
MTITLEMGVVAQKPDRVCNREHFVADDRLHDTRTGVRLQTCFLRCHAIQGSKDEALQTATTFREISCTRIGTGRARQRSPRAGECNLMIAVRPAFCRWKGHVDKSALAIDKEE